MRDDARVVLPHGTGPRLSRRRVVAAFAPLHASPEARQSQLTELVHGQDFDVHAQTGDWLFGQVRPLVHDDAARSGYVGWVDACALGDLDVDGAPPALTHRVSVLGAPVFMRADLKSHILQSLPLGALVGVIGEAGDYVQIGAGAYLHRLHLRALSDPEGDPVAVARRYLGQPYVWGGNGARGIDCSGLVQMSLAACGIDAPRDADQQEAALGQAVGAPERPGDLLFWPGHVGILGTRDTLLHANATHMGVVEEPLGPALERIEQAGTKLRAVRRF